MVAAIYLWSLEGPGGYHIHPEGAAGSGLAGAPAPASGQENSSSPS
jgi:hypothetical protein